MTFMAASERLVTNLQKQGIPKCFVRMCPFLLTSVAVDILYLFYSLINLNSDTITDCIRIQQESTLSN